MDEKSTTDRRHNENGKYIEINKLKDNILSLKYSSTNTNVKKPLHVNDDVKAVILNIIDDKFNKTLYKKLTQGDKVTIDQFVKTMKYGVDVNEGIQEKQRQFEILCGESNAGNNNELIKNKIKKYVLEAISEGIISKTEGHQIIFQLSMTT